MDEVFDGCSSDDLGTVEGHERACHMEDVAIQEEISLLKATVFDTYYPLILAQHSPPPLVDRCPECRNPIDQWIRCLDCFGNTLCCVQCTIQQHSKNPFHRTRRWDCLERCWMDIALSNLGLKVRIRHEDGSVCGHPGTSLQMRVMHSNGIHTVTLVRCGCTVAAGAQRTLSPNQCLANCLFPATSHSPQQAYTFQVLDLFNWCNLKAYTNINQFCEVMCSLSPGDTDVRVQLC
jgi:hypothetical protein